MTKNGGKAASAKKSHAPYSPEPEVAWTFLSNHAHVLLCLARDSEARMRDVAVYIGITERAVQRIVAELEKAGYIERIRDGRRNRYVVRTDLPLRHPIERHQTVAALINLVVGRQGRTPNDE